MDHQNRRDLFRKGIASAAVVAGLHGSKVHAEEGLDSPDGQPTDSRPFLTRCLEFEDVSRGDPIPHKLAGEALVKARLTPETWRLEITAEEGAVVERLLTISSGTALTYQDLVKLGDKHGVRYMKAMQCNNIEYPLGQGLWEGIPLRDVLNLCGKQSNARRLYYWGFHNNEPAQRFQSSLAMNQALDGPPCELTPIVAYRLNGRAIPLVRGGPVRMIVPWAHGFKSIKWLQNIVLTNNYHANDTYANDGNDPESYLKTAAYFDNPGDENFSADQPLLVRGTSIVGWGGLQRVEAWLREFRGKIIELAEEDPAWQTAQWIPAAIESPPQTWGDELPKGLLPKDVWGFDEKGQPKQWPLRFSVANWNLKLLNIKPGKYELRVRTIDQNGFAQPEPRDSSIAGQNRIQCKTIEVS